MNGLLVRILLRSTLAEIRRRLGYRKPIHVVTSSTWILLGLKNIVTVTPQHQGEYNARSRWASRAYKWEIGKALEDYEYFLYLDIDSLIVSPFFLEDFIKSGKKIGLMVSPDRSEYSHSLLPPEYATETRYDSCVIMGEGSFLKVLFDECVSVYRTYSEVFDRYGDMPVINRALVNVGVEPDQIHQVAGIPFAHRSSDYSQSLYHFNSGNLFSKWYRMARFRLKYSARLRSSHTNP